MHYSLQWYTYYRHGHLNAFVLLEHWYDVRVWEKCVYVILTFTQSHKKPEILSNTDGFMLLKKTSSFFPSSVWPDERAVGG